MNSPSDDTSDDGNPVEVATDLRPAPTRRGRPDARRARARAGPPARAARPAAGGGQQRGRHRRGRPPPRRRRRTDRRRRRAGVGLPLLPAGLPDPDPPRGLRHRAGRPDRHRRPVAPGAGARGARVDLPRRLAGPARAWPSSGLRPHALFDTELAGRLLGYPRVGLATMVEEVLGRRLRKEHSAVDWSTRPLPDPVAGVRRPRRGAARRAARGPARRARRRRQVGVGRAGVRPRHVAADAPPRAEPWRRTSGLHKARGRRALASVRALWHARDEIASERDVTPGRIIPDSAIVEAASAGPRDRETLLGLRGFHGRGARSLREGLAPGAARRPRAARHRPARHQRPLRRPAASTRVGRQEPGRRRAPGPGPRGAGRAGRGALGPGREPADARERPTRAVAAARRRSPTPSPRRSPRWARGPGRSRSPATLLTAAITDHPDPA